MTPAQQLGPYRLIERIGRGGMGEVWKARDTRLDRDVAIKVAAEQFSDRFEREARAIAALNHPNICTLFDIGPNYLVMELIDGPTLADRIAEGPIPLDESLAIAKQIADALEAAHEKNIIHRDLKPGNIKLRHDGSVKALDFGLAKAGVIEEVTHDSPTLLHSPTQIGVILGTAAYMAPEQARGKTVDKRADIWSFGVVLHEMLTGKRAFEGEDLTDTLASVVKSDPDLTVIPHKVRRLLAKCLQKDPKKRLRDIGDVWELLDNDAPRLPSVAVPAKPSRLWPAIAAAATIAAATLAFLHLREAPPPPAQARFTVSTPPGSLAFFAQISPDGRRIAITLATNGRRSLYLRSIDSEILTPVPGGEDARAPQWSPDSRFIAFFAGGKLKIAPAGGGPIQTLCDSLGSGGIAWGRDGTILYNATAQEMSRTTAAGGSCTPVGKSDDDVRDPAFLPDSKHFLYVHPKNDGSGGIYLADLSEVRGGSLHGRRLLTDISSAFYAPPANGSGYSYLLFLRGNSLMAQPFDEGTLQIAGESHLVADQASSSANTTLLGASASANGNIVYLSGLEQNHVLTWLDRAGGEMGKVGGIHAQQGTSLSPDGHYAVSRRLFPDGAELWLYDLTRNSERRLTPRGSGSFPVWSPEGGTVWVSQTGAGGPGIYRIDVATGDQEFLAKEDAGEHAIPSDRSRDGRYFVFTAIDPKTQGDIWSAPVESGKPGKAIKLVGTTAMDSQAQISPDGKWLAYYSNESGADQIYIRSFTEGGEAWTVSTSGDNREPRWRADGKEIFFLNSNATVGQSLMSVTVEQDGRGGLRLGTPQKLFGYRSLVIIPQANTWSYSPSPDGKRFLVNTSAGTEQASVKVILNWQAGLKE